MDSNEPVVGNSKSERLGDAVRKLRRMLGRKTMEVEILREIIAWTALANAGASGSDVRDMMLEAVEKRFRTTRAPRTFGHLSVNGSAYTPRDTRLFGQSLNLTPCFAPVASPQSNGMSEASLKTLKRDNIRVAQISDAEMALRLTEGWIDNYNETHPHSALKMASQGSSSG